MARQAAYGRRDLVRGLAGLAMVPLVVPDAAFAQTDSFIGNGADSLGRSSAPVWIDGRGPFLFAVDTAATGSVIADDLAQSLELTASLPIGVHTLAGFERAQTVLSGHLRSGALDVTNARLAVGRRAGLLGADGLIGTDLLADHRLILSFRGGTRASIGQPRLDNANFFQGPPPTLRFATDLSAAADGLLILEGNAYGEPMLAIIDTGAEVSIVNSALARVARGRLSAFRDGSTVRRIYTPIGATVDARALILPEININGGRVRRLPVLMGDFHTFDRLGLGDRPAMLMGIDVLRLYQKVVVDLRRRQMSFEW